MSGGASAKDHKTKVSDSQAYVVAHIPFNGLSVVDMAMQKKVNDKYYLYVQHSKEQGISIIDISMPAQGGCRNPAAGSSRVQQDERCG